MKLRYLFFIVLLALLFLVNWVNKSNQKLLSEVTFTDIDGVHHSLAQYKGQPILFIFWATDCPDCIQEMPELIRLHHEFASRGLIIIGVAMSHDNLVHIRAMCEDKQLPYLITWDHTAKIAKFFDNVRVTPTHFLISPDGEIIMRNIGSINMDLLHQRLGGLGLQPSINSG